MTQKNDNVVVLSSEQAAASHTAEFEQVKKLNVLAESIVRATARVGKMYLELCLYIRAKAIPPKVVAQVLGDRGFERSRIAEINKVANAADDVWNKFEAGTIGFRKALDTARGNVVDIVAETLGEPKNETVEGLEMASDDGEYVRGADVKLDAKVANSSGDEVETDARKLEKLCNQIFKLVDKMELRRKTVVGPNGYKIFITHDKKVLKASKEKSAAKKSSSSDCADFAKGIMHPLEETKD